MLLLAIITTFADIIIKHASAQESFSNWKLLLLGSLIYGLTGFGWFFAMRHAKLSTLGAMFAVTGVLLLSLVSVFYFKEKISNLEILGIIMAIGSLVILYRFTT
jgi:small multidrug resistance pump